MDTTDIDEIGSTSLMTAALRARESVRPDRLFDDDGARALVAADAVLLVAEHRDRAHARQPQLGRSTVHADHRRRCGRPTRGTG